MQRKHHPEGGAGSRRGLSNGEGAARMTAQTSALGVRGGEGFAESQERTQVMATHTTYRDLAAAGIADISAYGDDAMLLEMATPGPCGDCGQPRLYFISRDGAVRCAQCDADRRRALEEQAVADRLFCERCRHPECHAQSAEFPVCRFCEDGVPCPGATREARAQKAWNAKNAKGAKGAEDAKNAKGAEDARANAEEAEGAGAIRSLVVSD